jgi:DNA/RNA endonuclease G (NUC1)
MRVVLKRPALGFLAACAFLLAPHALGAESRNCTAVEKARADKQLWLNERDQKLSIEKHLPWRLPEPQGSSLEQRVLAHRDYVVGYSRELLVPLWTAHRVDKKWLGQTKCE